MTGGGSSVLEEYTRVSRQEKEIFVSVLVVLGVKQRGEKKSLVLREDICRRSALWQEMRRSISLY